MAIVNSHTLRFRPWSEESEKVGGWKVGDGFGSQKPWPKIVSARKAFKWHLKHTTGGEMAYGLASGYHRLVTLMTGRVYICRQWDQLGSMNADVAGCLDGATRD